MARILLVDDEDLIISLVRHTLRKEGHEVFVAQDGVTALSEARRHSPELVILDISMPNMSGLQVCERLRGDPKLADVPILFLTGLGSVQDRVQGLDAGGDDYLPKPFDVDELSARVRALLRRRTSHRRQTSPDNVLEVGDLSLDARSRRVRVGDREVELTPVETDLLRYLMAHADEAFSSEHLLQEVWGYHPGTGDTSLVRWHIKKLRAKIEPDMQQPRYLRTAGRHGYILTSPDPS